MILKFLIASVFFLVFVCWIVYELLHASKIDDEWHKEAVDFRDNNKAK